MYPYHNRIKQRIKNGELEDFCFVHSYRQIGACLLLFFKTEPYVRPIRPHRYEDYTALLKKYGYIKSNQPE
ncbi:MAG: hypothetical protein IJW78_05215 [Clostridia bacterium]|nr:hypothetical protein [Clostridia bacterium]